MYCHLILGIGSFYLTLISLVFPLICLFAAYIFISQFASSGEKQYFLYAFALIIIGLVVYHTFRRVFILMQQISIRGTRLRKSEFPVLFETLSKVRKQIKSPNLSRISIEPDTNISITTPIRVAQRKEHWLTIGISIFLTFSKSEFESLIGHELGHISGKKNKTSRRILQRLYKWKVLSEELSHRDTFCWFLGIPYRILIIPSLEKISDSMHWDNEWESDELSAHVFGKKPFARALLKIEIINVLQEFIFWETVFDPSNMGPEPPYHFYHLYREFILEKSTLQDWLTAARWVYNMPASTYSMHPSTAARLDKLGVTGENLDELTKQIFDTRQSSDEAISLLSDQADELIEMFNGSWHSLKKETWKNYLRTIHERRTAFDFLSRKKLKDELDANEWLGWLITHQEYNGSYETIPEWIQFLEEHPRNEMALLELGKSLCDKNDKSGLFYLDRLIDVTHRSTMKACWNLFYYREKLEANSEEHCKEIQSKISDYFDARWQINNISHHDNFEPMNLPLTYCSQIEEYITTLLRCKEAWVLKYHPSSMPEYTCTVIFLRVSAFQQPTERQISFILANLPLPYLEHCIVFPSIIPMIRWRKVLDLPGAKIF